MANRFPLIVDSSTQQIKELVASDNIDLTSSGIVNAASIASTSFSGTHINLSGVATASSFVGNTATFSGNVSVGGTLTYEDVTNIDSVGLVTARTGVRVTNGGLIVTSGVSTISGGLDLSSLLREGVNIVAGKLSDNTNINLDNGMVHFFTTTETTTSQPNIFSSVGINTQLAVGETSAVTIITTAAAAGYSTAINIDGTYSDVKWLGGIDPSTGGASGNDVYSIQIIKTGIGTFTVFGSVNNFA